MIHTVHLETGRHLYGGARQVLLLTEGLVRAGVHCTLVCPPDSEIRSAVHPDVQVEAMAMGGDLDVGFAFRFGKWLEQLQPSLLHVHSRRGADLWGGMAAKWARVPAVITRRVDNPEPALMAPMKYRRYERVIAISNGVLEQLRMVGVPENKLRLIHSAVDAQDCQPQWARDQFVEAFQLDPQSLVVVCVAQLIERKGHDVLLDAWNDISSACPTARLLLFGAGPEEDRLRQRVSESVAGGTIRFCGFRDDLRSYLGHADLLVHPARMEGLGIALLEAQAAGVPVVATKVGGIPEAVSNDRSGMLVPPDDAGELARVVVRLLRDEALRQQLGAGGRAHVAEQFSPAAMVSGNLAVYRELLPELA